MINIWEKILDRKESTVKFTDLIEMETNKWIPFMVGIQIRKMVTGIAGLILLNCLMKKGAMTDRHDHDYFESFVIIKGKILDKVSGVIMVPDGKAHTWREGTPHLLESLEDSEILVICKYKRI